MHASTSLCSGLVFCFFCCKERGAKGEKRWSAKNEKTKKGLYFYWFVVLVGRWSFGRVGFGFSFCSLFIQAKRAKQRGFLVLILVVGGCGGWWREHEVDAKARAVSLSLFFPLPLSNFTSSSSSSPRPRPTRQHRLPRKDHRLLQQQQPRQPRRRPQSPRRRG